MNINNNTMQNTNQPKDVKDVTPAQNEGSGDPQNLEETTTQSEQQLTVWELLLASEAWSYVI